MPQIAFIGAGPSALYTAQALVRMHPDLRIDMLDRWAKPHGLIRYGVAPDHLGTKRVARQFSRLFERQGVGFFGGIEVGRDLELGELRDLYDAVVLAVGLHGDRHLDIPGEELPGVLRSGALARWFNGYPAATRPPPLGARVVIVGNGNVALDLARMIAKGPEELGPDADPAAFTALETERVREVHVVGRSAAAKAKFDSPLLRELAHLREAQIRVEDLSPCEKTNAGASPNLAALADLQGAGPADAHCTIHFHFKKRPVEILGEERVKAISFRTEEGDLTLPASAVITAIGFEEATGAPLSRSEFSVDGAGHRLSDGLYAVGWFRRGPSGSLPDARQDAIGAARAILDDLSPSRKHGRKGLAALLKKRGIARSRFQHDLA